MEPFSGNKAREPNEGTLLTARTSFMKFGQLLSVQQLIRGGKELPHLSLPLRIQVRAIIAIFTLLGVFFASWVSRLPIIKQELSVTTGQMGILLFCLAAGTVAGLTVARRIQSSLGTQRGLAWTILVASVLLVLLGAATTYGLFPLVCLLLILYGAALSSTDVLMNVEGARIERELKRTFLPLLHAFYSFGNVIGAALGWFVGTERISIFAHYVIIAVLALAVAGLAVPALGTPSDTVEPSKAVRSERKKPKQLFRDPSLLMIALLVMFTAFAEGAGNDWISLAAFEGHQQSHSDASLVYAAFVGAMMIGRLIGGPLVDLLGRTYALAGLTVIGMIGIVLFIYASDVPLLFVGAFLWGLGVSLGFPLGVSAAANHPTDSAQRVSLVSIFGYAAMLSGPPVLGILGHDWGLLMALWIPAVSLVIAMIFIPVISEKRRSREDVTREMLGDNT